MKIWAVALIIAFIAGVMLMKKTDLSDRTLRVAFPATLKATDYEPTNINLDYEYVFLENVFSPLVEMDAKGVIQPGVAEKAEWIGDELRFTIRKGLKTQGGIAITADDVVFSLKRLLILSGNTHGNFKDIVCPSVELKSIEDNCPEIKKDGEMVVLKSNKRKSFLLPMLAAIDFAIIPRSSVDPVSLKIVNLRETSGPYYVSADDGHGHIELTLNKTHYHASENIPNIVKLVPSDVKITGSSLADLANDRVDLITTVDMAKADELLQFAKLRDDLSIHVSMKIRSLLLVFTERGMKDFSPEERRYIGEQMRYAFKNIFEGSLGFEQHEEFFPSLGDGGLTEDQQKRLHSINQQQTVKPTEKIKLGFIKRGGLDTWTSQINKYLPEADCYAETNAPDFKVWNKIEDMPHAFVAGTDTGFMEDINLISYSLNAGLLGLTKQERNKWLTDYMATDQKSERLKKLRDLHFHALAEPAIVPLMASPYAALVRKPWKIELSELYANNQLWLIKLQ